MKYKGVIMMNMFFKRKSLPLMVASVLTVSSVYAADKPEGHYQDMTPTRNKPYSPYESPKCQEQLEKFSNPSYIHGFKKEIYPLVSKASIISNDENTYVGVNESSEEIIIESNAKKLQNAIEKLGGKYGTKEDDKALGYFTDPVKKEIDKKTSIEINKPVRFKRVREAAQERQNDAIVANDPNTHAILSRMLQSVTVYNNPDEIEVAENPQETVIRVVKNDLISQAIEEHFKNPHYKIAIVNAADSENVGGGHIDGVEATIEESMHYVMPFLSPAMGIVAFAHGYPIPEKGVLCITSDIMRDFKTREALKEPIPVDLIDSVAYDMREKSKVPTGDAYLGGLGEKVASQLKSAAYRKNDILLLSAWGTGVFGNEPSDIIAAYKNNLRKFQRHFKEIIFVVLDGPEETRLNFRGEVVPNKNSAFFKEFGNKTNQ